VRGKVQGVGGCIGWNRGGGGMGWVGGNGWNIK